MKETSATKLAPEIFVRQLLPSIMAGVVIGILIVNIEISFASLIFSGPLSAHLADGIGSTLLGAMVIGAIVALTSSYPRLHWHAD